MTVDHVNHFRKTSITNPSQNKSEPANPKMPTIPPPSTIPPGSTVWTYLRDSGGEGQDRSVPRQENTIRAYCTEHKLILARIYKDVAKTGTTTAGRKDFHRMITDTKNESDRPNALLLWNFARFARDTDDGIYYKALLRKRGIKIHSLTDPIPTGPYARLVETMIETANEEKSRQTSIDVKAALQSLVTQGAVPGAPPRGIMRTPIETINPRTGAKRINHRWDPDPAYKIRVKTAYEMLKKGASLREIAEKTRIYKSKNSYTTFFKNPIYKGKLRYGELIIEDYCEPMVSKELWDDVQRIIQKRAQTGMLRKKKSHPRTQSGSYLLTGLLRCQKCGSSMTGYSSGGQKNGRTYRRYICTRAKSRGDCAMRPVPAEHLESVVLKNIIQFLEVPENLLTILNARHAENAKAKKEADETLKSLNAELGNTNRQLTRIANAIAETGHNQTLLAKLEFLETEKNTLLSEIAQTEAIRINPSQKITPAQAEELAKQLATSLKTKSRAKLRKVLLGIVSQITVDRNGKELNFYVIFYRKKKLRV